MTDHIGQNLDYLKPLPHTKGFGLTPEYEEIVSMETELSSGKSSDKMKRLLIGSDASSLGGASNFSRIKQCAQYSKFSVHSRDLRAPIVVSYYVHQNCPVSNGKMFN